MYHHFTSFIGNHELLCIPLWVGIYLERNSLCYSNCFVWNGNRSHLRDLGNDVTWLYTIVRYMLDSSTSNQNILCWFSSVSVSYSFYFTVLFWQWLHRDEYKEDHIENQLISPDRSPEKRGQINHRLTHLPKVPHICIRELGHHYFK